MEWKTVKISEIADIINGGTPKTTVPEYWDGDIPWLSVKDFNNGNKYVHNAERHITDSGLKNSATNLLYPEDIIISARGTVGVISMISSKMAFNQSCFGLRARDFDSHYLYYLLKAKVGELMSQSQGSVFDTIVRATFDRIECRVPARIEDQHRIAAILSSLDDKIENNNRINRNLEAQAQALFKSWFVDFEPWGGTMPEDWREVSLNEMTSKFGTGLNPRKNFKLGEGENYYVTIKNMGNNRIYLDDRCDKVTDEAIEKINKRSKLQAGDLLFSGIGTIGRVALVTETPQNWNTSESIFNMHPADTYSSEFLYVLLLSDLFQRYVKVFAQGGVQQGIRMASLKDFKIALPDTELRNKFDELITPIISRIKSIDKENDRLATLRDTLLPKLMRGDIAL